MIIFTAGPNPLDGIAPNTTGVGWLFFAHAAALSASLFAVYIGVGAFRRYRRARDAEWRAELFDRLSWAAIGTFGPIGVITLGAVTMDSLRWWPLVVLEVTLVALVLALWAVAARNERQLAHRDAGLGPDIERIP